MNGPLTVRFVRHGESVSNAADKVALQHLEGDRLTERGREQAGAAAVHLRGSEARRLLTSPLRRARETAAILAVELGLEPEVLPELTEVREGNDYGSLTMEEQIERRWSRRMAAGVPAPPGADSFQDLVERVRALKATLDGEHRSPIVAVGHGVFLRFFLADCLLGEAFTHDLAERLWQLASFNGAISTFERVEGDPLRVPVLAPWRCLAWMERPVPL